MAEPWREGIVYDQRFASWKTGVVLTVLASALSYFCTATYGDFMSTFRKQMAEVEAQRSLPAQGSRALRSGSFIASTTMRTTTVKPCRVLLFVILFITFVVLDFVALAALPLALFIPTAMLVFVWGSAYRAWTRSLPARDALFPIIVVLLVGVGIAAAPKGLYIVHVPRVVIWNAKSVIYTVAFLVVATVLHSLRRAGRSSSRDSSTVIRGILAGMLGGQALVLLKFVAEICENAIFHHKYDFYALSSIIVVSLSVVASGLHIFVFHCTLAELDEANIRLLIPVHRLSYIASASIGAGVYLEEWNVPGTPSWHMAAYYGVSLLGMALACIILARSAAETTIGMSIRTFGLAGRDCSSPSSKLGLPKGVVIRSPDSGLSDTGTLWGLGEPTGRALLDCTGGDGGGGNYGDDDDDDDDDDLEAFHMAHSRTMAQPFEPFTPSPEPKLLSKVPSGGERSRFAYGEAGVRDNEGDIRDGDSDSDESFRSFMDCESVGEEDEESATGQAPVPKTVAQTRAQNEGLNYDYPTPEETMVFPKAAGTSKSFWVDAGLNAGGWKVRGPTYDQDRIKVPCGEARMAVSALEWIYAPDIPFKHMSARENGFMAKHHHGRTDRPFLVVINFAIPTVGHYVTYLTRRPDIPDPIFDEMLSEFIHAEDDAYRNARLKLIPGVLEGSFLVRKAVGAKPALLCQKLATTYHIGPNHFEITIDVGSSVIGSKIFAAVKGFATGLVLHLGIVLESKTQRQLPERLMVGVDVHTPVMHPSAAPVFEEETSMLALQ